MISSNKMIKTAVIIGMCSILLASCSRNKVEEVVIAEQYGLAYAPIQVAKELGLFEKHMPEGIHVSYKKLANTTAIREAMLAGDLDVGFMGIPPFLIGEDKGMMWKMMTGLSRAPLGLVVNDDSVDELRDLIGDQKIALPQPGSIQHILLTMRTKDTMGDAKVFDGQLVSMKHPDGFNALMNDPNVVAHFTSPPYLFQELDEADNRLLVSGEEAFGGPFTFIVGVCEEEFYAQEEAYSAVNKGVEEAIEFMNTNIEDTVVMLAIAYELDTSVVEDYLYNRGMVYETDIRGTQRFIEFMFEEGYLDVAKEVDEVIW